MLLRVSCIVGNEKQSTALASHYNTVGLIMDHLKTIDKNGYS